MSSLLVYCSNGVVVLTRWCVVLSMRRTRDSWNVHAAMSRANLALPDLTPLLTFRLRLYAKEDKTHLDTSFLANLSLNISTPPTQVTLAPPRAWKPVATLSWLPAQSPSPPFSVASTRASAPPSESAAKLSGGAFRIGTSSGLLPSA